MFGALLRAAGNLVMGAVMGAFLAWMVGRFAPYFSTSNVLGRSLAAIGENATIVMILGAAITLLARANAERTVGG
jgi:predicted Kef-type K+ transport protein